MAEQNSEQEEKKPSKKRLIIIIVAVLLVLIGAGAGYYFFMGPGKSGDANQSEGGKQQDSKQASEKPVAEKSYIYFDMTQPLLVNFPKGLGASMVQVSLSFLVETEEVAASLKKHEPMLRNNLMMKINAQIPDELKSKEGKEALRALLLEEVNSVLSKMAVSGRVSEVFFTGFVLQ